MERAFRPTWTEQVATAPEPAAPAEARPAMSFADELSKLAKLRADGIITQAEFDDQKKKLLGR